MRVITGMLVAVLMLLFGTSVSAGYDLEIGHVNDNDVNCRIEPGLNHEVFIVLYAGSPIHMVVGATQPADGHQWQLVILSDLNGHAQGNSCWIAGEFVEKGDPALMVFDRGGSPEADGLLIVPEGMPTGNYVAESATGPSTPIEEYRVVEVSQQPPLVTDLPSTGNGYTDLGPFLTKEQAWHIVLAVISGTVLIGTAWVMLSLKRSRQVVVRPNTMRYGIRYTPYGADFGEE